MLGDAIETLVLCMQNAILLGTFACLAFGLERLVHHLSMNGASRSLCLLLQVTALLLVVVDCIGLAVKAVFHLAAWPVWTMAEALCNPIVLAFLL